MQVERQIEEEIASSYGFLPDLSTSIHLNARRVLGETPPESYFNTPSNLAFHDLTTDGSVPPATRTILGLSTKFIPTPKYTSSRKVAEEAYERFERDVSLKYHFAGEDNDWQKTKLYVKSIWRPPMPGIEVNSRLAQFESRLIRLFRKRKSRSNLTPFQENYFRLSKQMILSSMPSLTKG